MAGKGCGSWAFSELSSVRGEMDLICVRVERGTLGADLIRFIMGSRST